MMFLITNFATMECKCISLDKIDHPLWRMIVNRFGCNTAICMKTNTVMMGYENHLFTQLIINGLIDEINLEENS